MKYVKKAYAETNRKAAGLDAQVICMLGQYRPVREAFLKIILPSVHRWQTSGSSTRLSDQACQMPQARAPAMPTLVDW